MADQPTSPRRRVPRKWVGWYRRPKRQKPPSLEHLVDEARMVAHSATRMAVKNRLLVDAAGLRQDIDLPGLRGAARETLEQLAQQQRAAADYEAERGGDPRRGPVLRGLAEALEADAQNRLVLEELVAGAREAAWDELRETLTDRLGLYARRFSHEPDYMVGRETRVQDLISEDLGALAERAREKRELADALETEFQDYQERRRETGELGTAGGADAPR